MDSTKISPNTTTAEQAMARIGPSPTGIMFDTENGSVVNTSGNTYIYMAIRRGPLAPPTAGTEVFEVATRTAGLPSFNAPFAVDMGLVRKGITAAGGVYNSSRLTGTKFLYTNGTDAESNDSGFVWDFMDGWANDGGTSSEVISWMWKRAPGFFDVVAYAGDGTSGRTVSHNLTVAPEMIWIKRRDGTPAYAWATYVEFLGASRALFLERSDTGLGTGDVSPSTNWFWGDGSSPVAPDADNFTLGGNERVNYSSGNHIAYLFASLAGVSKVGSYTGDGVDGKVIDCGFTSGARFVLARRTDGASDWYLFDSVRGITAAYDPYLFLNNTDAQAAIDNIIKPDSSGFALGNGGQLNQSGGSFIFYAIA
tara:strand:- start:3 stop:1100 length:1098 start_codon:yes stop_codon:yes gene_type:complete